MSYRLGLNIDALIFSCYDVLIDTKYAYREVVRQTVQLYLERALGLSPSKEALITPEDVVLLQKIGNFSNYWELTKAFAMYFIEMLPPVMVPTFPSKLHVPALVAYLQFAGGNLRVSIDTLLEQSDIAKLAADIAAVGGGLNGAGKVLPAENRHLLVASGEITKVNIIGRIFQELYLGAELFERVYNQPAIVIQGTGYAEHESLIINPNILAQISDKLPLGVVSDRPRREVEQSLKAKNIDQYFQSIVALDDIRAAQANPIPDSWTLLEAAHLLQPTPAHSAYIGTTAADIWAAKQANNIVPFTAIGCLVGAHNKADLQAIFEQHKATMILGHPNHLKELILG